MNLKILVGGIVLYKGGDNMLPTISDEHIRINASIDEYIWYKDLTDRKLFLTQEIGLHFSDEDGSIMSVANSIVKNIIDYNQADADVPVSERKPIRLYIDSPGGNITDGFAIVDAILCSQTPVYTVNIGQWASMAFLIGISGHKRFSFPHATFLMHDGSTVVIGSANKAGDQMKFSERFAKEVIKDHVLRHSNMTPVQYDALERVEFYLLPKDALEYSFIDEIVEDITTII